MTALRELKEAALSAMELDQKKWKDFIRQ